MSKSIAHSQSILDLILNNTSIAGLALSSSPAGDLYIALHTADVGEAGNQSTNELTYVDYVRLAVPRNGRWTIDTVVSGPDTLGRARNANEEQFVVAGVGTTEVTATHFSLGDDATDFCMSLFWKYTDYKIQIGPKFTNFFLREVHFGLIPWKN